MRILLATDAWPPQVNGVVRTLTELVRELERLGHSVETIHPGLFPTVPCPGYPEIRLAYGVRRRIAGLIEAARPDAVHVVSEGPIGIAARACCIALGWSFTTAFHTRFPEYLAERFRVPARLTYALLRRFHAPAHGVMVPTPSIGAALAAHGFGNLRTWTRGVDHSQFSPTRRQEAIGFARPVFLSVGRIAHEKNLPAFLGLDLPGSKVVVGEGPELAALRRRYGDVHFLGRRENGALATLYASADVFMFPSRTDTFGLVLLEALASGLPVAAYPVPGPLDVIGTSGAGVLDPDLRNAALGALDIPRERCRSHALTFSWAECARQFVAHLCPAQP